MQETPSSLPIRAAGVSAPKRLAGRGLVKDKVAVVLEDKLVFAVLGLERAAGLDNVAGLEGVLFLLSVKCPLDLTKPAKLTIIRV